MAVCDRDSLGEFDGRDGKERKRTVRSISALTNRSCRSDTWRINGTTNSIPAANTIRFRCLSCLVSLATSLATASRHRIVQRLSQREKTEYDRKRGNYDGPRARAAKSSRQDKNSRSRPLNRKSLKNEAGLFCLGITLSGIFLPFRRVCLRRWPYRQQLFIVFPFVIFIWR